MICNNYTAFQKILWKFYQEKNNEGYRFKTYGTRHGVPQKFSRIDPSSSLLSGCSRQLYGLRHCADFLEITNTIMVCGVETILTIY